MKKNIFGVLFAVLLMISGCKGLNETINLKNCEYSFRSITDVTISGKAGSDLNFLDLISIYNASTIPLNFTINVDVKNPNSDAASFYSLLYIIYIDDVRITDGEITDPFYVGGGQSAILPAHISLDIKDLMETGTPTRPVMENLIMNFLDLSDTPSKITIQVKPSFKVLDITFSAPDYVSADFTYGGE
ncbi:MAG: LEA type 2 family protein [Tannerella sp.]|jgi:LEA14-like dessication related protein|nr:LEA type 2 family protein [Tannerella sp.]